MMSFFFFLNFCFYRTAYDESCIELTEYENEIEIKDVHIDEFHAH